MGSRSWFGALGTVAIMLAAGVHVSPARGEVQPEGRRRVAGATVAAIPISAEAPRDLRGTGSKAGRRLRTAADATASAVARDLRSTTMASSASGGVAGTICTQPDGNCQQRDTYDALTSNRTNFTTADDFRPTADGSITSICWWGAYARRVSDRFVDCVGEAADTYEVKYYQDAGGVPGVELEAFSQADGTLNVTGPIPTGDIVGPVINQIPEYAFTATHPAVPVLADGCYWIEITNNTLTCTWFWVVGVQTNGFATQDGNGVDPPDGYTVGEWISNDMGFCLDIPLADSAPCAPAAPGNDDCANAEPISTEGIFPFDNTFARTDGPEHDNCLALGDTRHESDVWYCWTAPCTDSVFAATCGLTDVDTWIAVYDGCDCPVGDANLLACNDDLCGTPTDARQSLTAFPAVAGQSYLIRVGSFPGEPRGAGSLGLTCGPPENPSCPGAGSCCEDTASPACDDELCCRTVCTCDPFCCEVEWDEFCAMGNLEVPGCDAISLCAAECDICGSPTAGDCCTGNPDIRGCSDAECCEAVCALDSFCCEVEWDESCANKGVGEPPSGYGAAVQCPTLCGAPSCPTGPINFVEPLDGVVDARQPYPPSDTAARQGIDTIIAEAPAGADDPACWSLCESVVDGVTNAITGVVDNGDGTVTISLLRSISTGAVTTIMYADDAGLVQAGTFTSHPANADGDSAAGPPDILKIIDYINGVANSPWGIYSEDVDHSDSLQPPDILRVIDLLNGAGSFDVWLNTPLPGCGNCCAP